MNVLRFLLASLVLGVASVGFAQDATRGSGPHRPGPHGRGGRHLPPVIAALDINKDRTISADEIAQAPASLTALDKNGDGKLSGDEIHPARPADAPTPPANAPMMHRGNPVMLALDANTDGELSATEITNATASLKALDANKDGQLTPDELHPIPPQE